MDNSNNSTPQKQGGENNNVENLKKRITDLEAGLNASKDLIEAFKGYRKELVSEIDDLKEQREILVCFFFPFCFLSRADFLTIYFPQKKRLFEAEIQEEETHKTQEQKEKEKNRATLKAWLEEHQAEKEEKMRIAMLQAQNRELEFQLNSVRNLNSSTPSRKSNSSRLPQEGLRSTNTLYYVVGAGVLAFVVGYFVGTSRGSE